MYLGEVNKEKLQKELYVSCRKVLSSEISAYNKVTAHNIFVITIITLTFGIINWTVEELKEINNRTCKILSMNNSFHPDLNIDSIFYIPWYQGRTGLKSVKSLFECEIVLLYNQLEIHKNRNEYVSYVYQLEERQSIKVGQEFINKNNIVTTPTDKQ